MAEKILEINDIYKRKKKKKILKGVTFEVGEQEIVCLLAPNGSGKTTIIKCITGLFKLNNGSISICGHDIKKERNNAYANLGLCMETPSAFGDLSGMDNLKFIASAKKIPKEQIEEVIDFSGIRHSIDRPVRTYSLGMKMRLGLSMAMLGKPKLIVLDEPTNGLDVDAVIKIREKLLELKESGCSILISSHYLGEMEKIADRVVALKDGQVIKDITMLEIKNQYGELEKMYKDLYE